MILNSTAKRVLKDSALENHLILHLDEFCINHFPNELLGSLFYNELKLGR